MQIEGILNLRVFLGCIIPKPKTAPDWQIDHQMEFVLVRGLPANLVESYDDIVIGELGDPVDL